MVIISLPDCLQAEMWCELAVNSVDQDYIYSRIWTDVDNHKNISRNVIHYTVTMVTIMYIKHNTM